MMEQRTKGQVTVWDRITASDLDLRTTDPNASSHHLSRPSQFEVTVPSANGRRHSRSEALELDMQNTLLGYTMGDLNIRWTTSQHLRRPGTLHVPRRRFQGINAENHTAKGSVFFSRQCNRCQIRYPSSW
jgi:hypothetical protein